jgi:hypothetical protein
MVLLGLLGGVGWYAYVGLPTRRTTCVFGRNLSSLFAIRGAPRAHYDEVRNALKRRIGGFAALTRAQLQRADG